MPVNGGRLLVFEGLDGCGKSTQLAKLARALRAAGHDVLETAEPTGGSFGRRIRALARAGEPLAPDEELRLFASEP